MGSIKGLVTEMGKVMEIRNNALLEQGMGMGEYTWIYVLTYNSWLGYAPNTGVEDGGGEFTNREQTLIADLMTGYADALSRAGRTEDAELWRAEVKKLEWNDGGTPFGDGTLPTEITAVLEPYRTRLEASYCATLADIDLGQIKKKGLSFHSN